MQLKKIFPMEVNLVVRNLKSICAQRPFHNLKDNGAVRYFFLDAATYNNLGDQAIAYAISCFMKELAGEENYYAINESELLSFLASLKKQIKDKDVLILSGGGNMGDLYPRYEAIRRKVIREFPKNKVIIFPQTIDYAKDNYGRKAMLRSSKTYRSHHNLIVCARESRSFELMRSLYNKVVLIPDIVLYLYGKLDLGSEVAGNGVGLCLRHDKEAAISEGQKAHLVSLCKESGLDMEELTMMTAENSYMISDIQRGQAIVNKVKEFKKYKLIITDRLHGMIFSILADVPCLAIDNSNHKVSGVFETVKDRLCNVKVINAAEINDLNKIPEFSDTKTVFHSQDIFKQLYSIVVSKE